MAQGTIKEHAISSCYFAAALVLGLGLCVLLPNIAHASTTATNSAPGATLCFLMGLIAGNLGRALATLAIIFLGAGAMLGKVSWGLALTVATGIAVTFAGPAIVSSFITAIGGYSTAATGC